MFLTKEQLELLKKEGWQPMTTKDGTAWFGGKSHKELAKYVPVVFVFFVVLSLFVD